MKQIWTFVITGGPCSGKTTALSTIKQELNNNGYHVLIKVAQKLTCDKVVILCDRGLIDNKSYVSEERFQEILSNFSLDEPNVKSRYNAVFHLVTAANGAEEFYTLSNNSARTETAEEARNLDMLGIKNWTGHPHFHVIDNSTDFNGKMKRLMDCIYSILNATYNN